MIVNEIETKLRSVESRIAAMEEWRKAMSTPAEAQPKQAVLEEKLAAAEKELARADREIERLNIVNKALDESDEVAKLKARIAELEGPEPDHDTIRNCWHDCNGDAEASLVAVFKLGHAQGVKSRGPVEAAAVELANKCAERKDSFVSVFVPLIIKYIAARDAAKETKGGAA